MTTKRTMAPRHTMFAALICLFALFSPGCGNGSGGDSGAVTFVLEAEDSIVDGLSSGDGVEDLVDGWSATFSEYIVAIGQVEITLATDQTRKLEDHESFVVDLQKVAAAGLPLWDFGEVDAGRWNVSYAFVGAGDGAAKHESVTDVDYEQMMSSDATFLIRGAIDNAAGQSCPPASKADVGDATPNGNKNGRDEDCYDNPRVTFELLAEAETVFGPCEVDEMPGFAVPAGGSQSAALTIHGDHLFFNGFPEGGEGGISRRAQWWADADLNLDGVVSREELEALAPSDMAEFDSGYEFGASPIEPLDSLWTYISAQLKTQGHFQGEGECPFDGMAHDHDDE